MKNLFRMLALALAMSLLLGGLAFAEEFDGDVQRRERDKAVEHGGQELPENILPQNPHGCLGPYSLTRWFWT